MSSACNFYMYSERKPSEKVLQVKKGCKNKQADLKKVTFCSPAEIEGSKMFPRTRKIDLFKNRDKCA